MTKSLYTIAKAINSTKIYENRTLANMDLRILTYFYGIWFGIKFLKNQIQQQNSKNKENNFVPPDKKAKIKPKTFVYPFFGNEKGELV